MSDEDQDYIYDDAESERGNRTRIALIAILVLLILMLAGLGFFITQVVTPAGAPRAAKEAPVGLEWIRSLYGYGSKVTDMFYRPIDTAIAPDGTIYGTDPQRSRILIFSADGTFRRVLTVKAPKGEDPRVVRPDRLAVADNGDLYVCDYGAQQVVVFSPDGTEIRRWDVPAPSDIVVTDQRVLVATAFGIADFKLDGTLIGTWGRRGRGPEEFDNPHGIVVADDGTVYIADTLNARIKAYTSTGKLKWIWPADQETAKKTGIVPQSEDADLQVPTGMTLDGRGRLVLVDPFSFQIIVLQPEAKGARVVGRYGEPGEGDGKFNYPDGISYDSARDWFAVADTRNNRVQIVRIPNSTSSQGLAALRRTTTGPVWLCTLPLILLLLAVIVAVSRRRARYQASEAADE